MVLRRAGFGACSDTGRGPCPVHRGANRSAFAWDRTRARCFSVCGRSWDSIGLAMALFTLEFIDAIAVCAELGGLRHLSRSSASVRDAIERTKRERAECDAAAQAFKEAELIEVARMREARDDQELRTILVRLDPDQRDPRVQQVLRDLGDPFLAEEAARERLIAIEERARAWREGRVVRHGVA